MFFIIIHLSFFFIVISFTFFINWMILSTIKCNLDTSFKEIDLDRCYNRPMTTWPVNYHFYRYWFSLFCHVDLKDFNSSQHREIIGQSFNFASLFPFNLSDPAMVRTHKRWNCFNDFTHTTPISPISFLSMLNIF